MPRSFVGRQRDVAELADVVDAAAAGRGSLTLVCGEPGIGKTALVEETARAAEGRGVVVRWATCWEGEGQPPYWPWLQVVRAELGGAPTGQGVADLLLGSAHAADARAASFALFDALAAFVLDAARASPRMIVVDDLHWADASSLRFLLFLARELCRSRVAIVATCRDVDVDPASPVLEVLPDLCRLGRVVTLSGLDNAEVAALLRGAGTEPGADTVGDVFRQSGGNPLFASELARLGVASSPAGRAVPLGIREVIGRRLARFDAATVAVLEAAAVLGQRFDATELAGTSDVPEPAVHDRLAGPVAARLVVGGGGRGVAGYAFAHDLVRRRLLERMPLARRAAMHGRAADTIAAASPSPDEAPRIAAHRVEAAVLGDRAAAVDACVTAAAHARDALAHDEAASHLRTAVRLADEDRAGAAGRGVGEVLASLAEAEWRAGHLHAALAAASRAVEEARRSGDAVVFARAALASCVGAAQFEPRRDLVVLLDEGLSRLGGDHPSLAARLLARESMLLMAVGGDLQAVSERAVETARASRDDGALALALQARYQAVWRHGLTAERVAIAVELREIAARTGDRDLAMEATLMGFVVALERGDGDGVTAALAEIVALAAELRRPLWRFYAASRTAAVAIIRGRYGEAVDAIDEADAAAPPGVGEPPLMVRTLRFLLAMTRGDRDLGDMAAGLLAAYRNASLLWAIGCQAAYGFLVAGDTARAAELVRALRRQLAGDRPVDFSLVAGTVLLSEVCVGLEVTEALPELYDVLIAHEAEMAIMAGFGAIGPVDYFLGRLAAAMGRNEVADRHFGTALDVAERIGSPPWVARIIVAWTGVLDALGRPAEAAQRRAQLGDHASPPARPVVASRHATLRLEGDQWRISLDGETSVLRDTKGLHYLAELVAHPGVERHALDLVAITEGSPVEPGLDRRHLGDAGALLDPKAKEAYRRRLEDLRDDVAEAEAFHDDERAARARAEIDALVQELSRAVGLGGRDRRAASAAERARLNVTRALRAAIARVEAALPGLGAHLDQGVRTGVFCAYEPEGDVRVRVERSTRVPSTAP